MARAVARGTSGNRHLPPNLEFLRPTSPLRGDESSDTVAKNWRIRKSESRSSSGKMMPQELVEPSHRWPDVLGLTSISV